VFKSAGSRIDAWGEQTLSKSLGKWKEVTLFERNLAQQDEERRKVKEIMKNSKRGERTASEKDTLRKFLIKLACVPKELTNQTMDQLCNEIDYFHCVGQSIVFLQGDFGNVYYIIALGEVALYLELSKDREMSIGREFGHLRGVPYTGTKESLSGLGINIVNLKAGSGFGEIAILSTTQKLRNCAAVAANADTFLFILHGDTYNAVLRQQHYRQRQLSAATSLLQNLPLFNHYSYSRLSNIAYTMRSQGYSTTSVVVTAGTPITKIMLVNTGQVKVVQPIAKKQKKVAGEATNTEILESRLPMLAVAILGRGSVIGESELHHNQTHFQMTYVSCSPDCEVFEMPLGVYLEYAASAAMKETPIYQQSEKHAFDRDIAHSDRISRAIGNMKKIVMNQAQVADDRVSLLKMLPILIDGIEVDDTAVWGADSGKPNLKDPHKFEGSTSESLAARLQTASLSSSSGGRGGGGGSGHNSPFSSPFSSPGKGSRSAPGSPRSSPSPRSKKIAFASTPQSASSRKKLDSTEEDYSNFLV